MTNQNDIRPGSGEQLFIQGQSMIHPMRTLMTICEAPALHEGRALPNPLYHATPSDRVASIMQHGLGGVQMKNFEVSRSNVVYLSDDPDAAESYAANAILMASDNPSRFPMGRMDGVHSSGITTFQIDSSKLDRSLFRADRNHEKAVYGGRSFEYHGIIPPDALFVYYTS